MKRLNLFAGILISVMAVWVLVAFFEAVIYAFPMVTSIVVWYRGWNEVDEKWRLLALGLVLVIAFGDGYFVLNEVMFNPELKVDLIVHALLPTLLFFTTYQTRNMQFTKTVPFFSTLSRYVDLDMSVYQE